MMEKVYRVWRDGAHQEETEEEFLNRPYPRWWQLVIRRVPSANIVPTSTTHAAMRS